MYCRNPAIDEAAVERVVRDQYGGRGTLRFVPLGRDSWCYVLGDLWVSVRRDLLGHRPDAYDAACELHDSGLDFLLSARRGADGRVTRRVAGFPVVVYPFVTGARAVTVDDHRAVDRAMALLSRLHEAKPPPCLPVERPDEPHAEALCALLAQPAPASRLKGPYSRRVADALAEARSTLEWCAERLRRATHHYATVVAAGPRRRVTHGDAGAQNLMIAEDGRMLLCDLGGLALAPPERDWFHLDRSLGTVHDADPELRAFYAVRWLVTEILEYGTALQRAHAADDDAAQMWRELEDLLAAACQARADDADTWILHQ